METVKLFISSLMIAISNCSLYEQNSRLFDELVKRTFSSLYKMLEDQFEFEIMVIDNEMIVNKSRLKETDHNVNLMWRLKRKGITRIDFLKGITLQELKQFIIDVSKTGRGLKSHPHIRAGTVDVNVHKPELDALALDNISSYVTGEVDKVRDILHSASPFKALRITGLDEVVVNFLGVFKKQINILKMLIPIRSFSEYTYTHATNVAVLSIFQGERLGIHSELLHELGVSALLHDAGKLFISNEILEKKGALDKEEFEEIKKHPLYGARYLAKMTHLTHLAPVIAFEHHMKYDCSGYPQTKSPYEKQHICSQIVAISDFFDAMRSRRPYRESVDIKEILVLMKKNAGTDFNPYLVDNFIRIIRASIGNQGESCDKKMEQACINIGDNDMNELKAEGH